MRRLLTRLDRQAWKHRGPPHIDMANATKAAVHSEEAHWAFTTLSHLDTWCGATCHTALRYTLRCLLVLALAGTLVAIPMRTIDPKRRAELKRKVGVINGGSLLEKSELESATGLFGVEDMGTKVGGNARVLNGGPDVKDSCAMM